MWSVDKDCGERMVGVFLVTIVYLGGFGGMMEM